MTMSEYQDKRDEERRALRYVIRNAGVRLEDSDGAVCVNIFCSDLFAWGVSDYEELPKDQIVPLYKRMIADKTGCAAEKWVCVRRNMQPQKPIKDAWLASGCWDNEMESLRKNWDEMSEQERQAFMASASASDDPQATAQAEHQKAS